MARILVVDDEPANRLLVSTLLGYAGHRVSEAASGAEALRTAAATSPDLILLDLSLPDMNGTEVVQALRREPSTSALRVALYTATREIGLLRDFMESYGIRHVVPKPCEPQELIAAIDAALED